MKTVKVLLISFAAGSIIVAALSFAFAVPLPGGTLDPLAVPKYVTPLVIPPVMKDNGMRDSYDIAVREFRQQILPAGFPATPVWSYGPASDPVPLVAPAADSQFNYPAYTVETRSNFQVKVRWRNELVAINPVTGFPYPSGSPSRAFLPHLLPIDQTLHWANPPASGCIMGMSERTDCATNRPDPYIGPVPIVTHVHGSHVQPHSDGYPEAWFLPEAGDIPAGYATRGSFFDDATGTNPGNLGYADFRYLNDQPATTLWYHDHSLGMTRSNVYAGPAGFWIVRGGKFDKIMDASRGGSAVLPWPAPVAGQTVLQLNIPGDPVRNAIREIPIAIQDRSFNQDGSLFYPDNRAFFEGLNVPGLPQQFAGAPELRISFVPDSDIAPIWNPEAFFNVMVVNGSSWPSLDVAPAKYRFRLLNGCNSRFLNLALKVMSSSNPALVGMELPFYQIGAEQGFLPQVVRIETGFATLLPGDGTLPPLTPAGNPQQALLMALAERADVIVDFSDMPDGTVVRMINTAPDAPFGHFPDAPADPDTTGQVMQFLVSSALLQSGDGLVSSPLSMRPKAEKPLKAEKVRITRQVSLNEMESDVLCVDTDIDGNLIVISASVPPLCLNGGFPFAPREALLGQVDLSNPAAPLGIPLKWDDLSGVSTPVNVTLKNGTTLTVNVTENPKKGDVEDWEIYNFTEDAHPIHLHLVRFEVVSRRPMPGVIPDVAPMVQPWERGYKDTVIAHPREITTVRAKFDISGLYVWHCHIVEHEDNEMMRPYVVSR